MAPLLVLAILGLVQGVTEFLPVSSSAHLVFGLAFLPGADALEDPESVVVLLHLGTLVAVLLFYRRRLLAMAAGLLGAGPEAAAQARLVLHLAVATAPAVAAALLAGDEVDRLFERPLPAAIALLGTGVLLALTPRIRDRGGSLESLSLVRAAGIGLIQVAAIMPGISRSGSTIAGGLLLGLSAENAVHFSFLMSIPAILGAVLFDLGDAFRLATGGGMAPALALGVLASFVAGFLSLGFLLWIARRRRLAWFAPYCWLAGGAVLLASL